MKHPKDALIAATVTATTLFNLAHPHDPKHEPHLPESSRFSTFIPPTFAVGSNMAFLPIDDDF